MSKNPADAWEDAHIVSFLLYVTYYSHAITSVHEKGAHNLYTRIMVQRSLVRP